MRFSANNTLGLMAFFALASTGLAAPLEGRDLQAREAQEVAAPIVSLDLGSVAERDTDPSSPSSIGLERREQSLSVKIPGPGGRIVATALTVAGTFLHDAANEFAVKLANSGADVMKWSVFRLNDAGRLFRIASGSITGTTTETIFLPSDGLATGTNMVLDVTKA